jgi:hypothetical protein
MKIARVDSRPRPFTHPPLKAEPHPIERRAVAGAGAAVVQKRLPVNLGFDFSVLAPRTRRPCRSNPSRQQRAVERVLQFLLGLLTRALLLDDA